MSILTPDRNTAEQFRSLVAAHRSDDHLQFANHYTFSVGSTSTEARSLHGLSEIFAGNLDLDTHLG